MIEIAARDAVKADTFEAIAQAIDTTLPIPSRYYKGPRALDETTFVRELRMATYQEDLDAVNALFNEVQFAHWRGSVNFYALFREMLTNPFDADWMNTLSEEFLWARAVADFRALCRAMYVCPRSFLICSKIAMLKVSYLLGYAYCTLSSFGCGAT